MATAELTAGLTKRLGYEDLNQTQHVDVEELIKVMRNPTVQGFHTAVNLVQTGNQQRFNTVLEAAREQAEAVGEADLRRLKRQFSSLKNTFLHYEVKDEFIAALSEGLPNGTEQAQLEQLEAEVAKNVEALRGLKAENEDTQAAIAELIAAIEAVQEASERQRAATAADLMRLQQDMAQHETQMAELLPELPPGLPAEECGAGLEAAGSEMRGLEAQIAAAQAEAARLEAVLAADREEVEVLRAHLAQLEATSTAEGERVESNTRFVQAGVWAEQMAALTTSLAGVSLLHLAPGEVHLKLLTAYPTGRVAGEEVGPCASGDHELSITLAPGSGLVAGARLHPADIDISELVEAARASQCKPDYLVTEVQAALGRLLHWRALVGEVQPRFTVLGADEEQATLRAALGQGVEAEVQLVQSWPPGGDVVHVLSVRGAADEIKAQKAAQLRFGGRSLLEVLEAIQRELLG